MDALIRVTNEIKSSNIYDNLKTNPTAEPNCNYDIIYKQITRAKSIHMSSKIVQVNRYKHKKSNTMTRGLLTPIIYRYEIEKQLQLSNPSTNNYETIKTNIKTRVKLRSFTRQFSSYTYRWCWKHGSLK